MLDSSLNKTPLKYTKIHRQLCLPCIYTLVIGCYHKTRADHEWIKCRMALDLFTEKLP